MANKHILSLDIPDTLNKQILRVVDTSVYSDTLPVECPRLQVLTPGATEDVTLEVTAGADIILTACSLGLQTSNCDTLLSDLPDGVYAIRYSVSPNDKVYVEYNHMRITAALKTYYDILCSINLSGCEPTKEQKDRLHELRLWKTMLEAAKSKVEYCHKIDEGTAMYNYALSRLQKLSCTYCN